MRTITILAYNRPEYLRQTIEALSKCRGIEKYHVILSIDGGGNIKVDDSDFEVIYQEKNHGVDRHNEAVYRYVFDVRGVELNVCLEDDVLLTPDALELVEWYAALPERSRYALLSLGNFDKQWNCTGDPYQIVREEEKYTFCTAAYVLGRESWDKVRGKWSKGNRVVHGWDWELSFTAFEEGWQFLTPVVSRCTNIGRVGVHSFGEWFDANVVGALCSDGKKTEHFCIEQQKSREIPEWIKAELRARS